MADVNLAGSSDVVIDSRDSIETGNEAFEPASKKQRKEESNIEKTKNVDERLETRLGGILCCSVCLDLPSSAVYQVSLSLFLFVEKQQSITFFCLILLSWNDPYNSLLNHNGFCTNWNEIPRYWKKQQMPLFWVTLPQTLGLSCNTFFNVQVVFST